jgi:23S rRNA pseudouridine955/2504/2580 synthase
VLLEDEDLLVVDKPGGVAVHGGSGISSGVIEQLRQARSGIRFLELVHRLDRDTSGVLVLAKKRSALTGLHAQLRDGAVKKHYLVLVLGEWNEPKRNVKLALHKYVSASGERRVVVDEDGAQAHTVFRLERNLPGFSLLDAELKTGRTHQIRVHLAQAGHAIAGDPKYGDFEGNKALARGEQVPGLRFDRMFLHARRLRFTHPDGGQDIELTAPLPQDCETLLRHLRQAQAS